MQNLENPFTPESRKPKRSLTELFRRGKKEDGENEIDKALKEALSAAKAVKERRNEKDAERQRIEDLFDTELSDQAYTCIQSLIKIGYSDEKLLEVIKIEDEEIHDLDLSGLTSAEHLTLPKSIGGHLDLRGLTSAEHLTLPGSIGGYLALEKLTSAEHLTLPKSIGGYLDLSGLTSAEDLTLPDFIGRDLYLNELTSAEHLTLPKSIGGSLILSGLTSAEHLILPNSIGEGLGLSGLSDDEKEKLRERYPQHTDKIK